MSQTVALERTRRARALRSWAERCQEELNKEHRYPEMDFYSDVWPLRSKYKTITLDISFVPTMAELSNLDDSYSKAMRCLATEWAIANKNKHTAQLLRAWRLLARTGPTSLFDLTRSHLIALEANVLQECKGKPLSASRYLAQLQNLASFLDQLVRLKVVEPVLWSVSHATRKLLKDLARRHQNDFKKRKASILDRQIEALSDAMTAMFKGDKRLSAHDHAALACAGIMMCAPSRVNEPLSMAVDDVFTLEDYAISKGQEDEMGRIHMLLLQKGSKGGHWDAKPALNFMVGLLKECMRILTEGGKRSRMLATWYEQHPNKLYLPPNLEHHRDQLIDRKTLWQIVNLSNAHPTNRMVENVKDIFAELQEKSKLQTLPNTNQFASDGRKNPRPTLQAAAWHDLEPILLRRVGDALVTVRHVTPHNHYSGQISKMLMLFDSNKTPYLPRSIKYKALSARFKRSNRKGKGSAQTIFEKLDLRMVVDSKVEWAWMETHDPRRWLTTQALQAKERLSDVLINKWANRLSIEQLKNYDLRSDNQKADQAAMPRVVELSDLSGGLQKIASLEVEFGLETEIIVANDAGVSATSMEAIASAVEDRPVARTSSQIIILYPTRFGACVHQHHQTPCRSYTCLPCSENNVVKGHLPTNDRIRARDKLLTSSIVNQLERLVTAHNREIADCPDGLQEHILTLAREGLTPEDMAYDLIARFHEIKDRIKSSSFRSKLEEAFVARGMVQRLDEPRVASGALIRYHNPARHASPGHERALDAHGGRKAIDARLQEFHLENPEFAPKNLGLQDQQGLLEHDDEEDDDE